MKRLSGLDATFLHLESPEMPMHVGALHIFELPPGYRGRFVNALRKHMAARLPIAPALRRRLWLMPLNLANPVWVDAVPDLKQHIVEVKLPAVTGAEGGGRPGAARGRWSASCTPQLLDRSRPLWKFHVIEGLAPGDRRPQARGDVHAAAPCRGRWPGRRGAGQCHPRREPERRARIEARASGRNKRFELGLVEMISRRASAARCSRSRS